MAALYDVSLSTVNEHIKKIYEDGELTKKAVNWKFRIVQNEGSRQTKYAFQESVSQQTGQINVMITILSSF